jgi:hypothetical protein
VLDDGGAALVSSDRTSAALPALGPVGDVVAGGGGLVIVPALGELALADSCIADRQDLGLLASEVGSLALATDRMAAIAPAGGSVTIFRLGASSTP